MKVNFIDDDHFIVYYLSDNNLKSEEEIKTFFILLNYDLKKIYKYYFHGLYNVEILSFNGFYILDFDLVEDFGNSDFDITVLLNTKALYEFEDSDLINDNKIYYNGKFYVEIDRVIHDIHFFEYGNVIYGKDAKVILNNGILVNMWLCFKYFINDLWIVSNYSDFFKILL